MLERIDDRAFADRMGLSRGDDGEVPTSALVTLARRALHRWGVAREGDIRAYLYRQLHAASLLTAAAKERVQAAITWLPGVREAELAYVDRERRLLRALPTLVCCGDVAFLCGTVDVPPGPVEQVDAGEQPLSRTRWVRLHRGDAPDEYYDAGFGAWTLEDWLGEPDYQARLPDCSDLPALWAEVSRMFGEHSGPISDSDSFRVVAGRPGQFFGQARTSAGGTRWRECAAAPDGTWCGARLGYGGDFTVPVMLETRGGVAVRARDLYDWDQWRWVLLSRGLAMGDPERVSVVGHLLGQTCELPIQLRRLLEVTSARPGGEGWRWETFGCAHEAVVEAVAALGCLVATRA
jgi:hypothetical protein